MTQASSSIGTKSSQLMEKSLFSYLVQASRHGALLNLISSWVHAPWGGCRSIHLNGKNMSTPFSIGGYFKFFRREVLSVLQSQGFCLIFSCVFPVKFSMLLGFLWGRFASCKRSTVCWFIRLIEHPVSRRTRTGWLFPCQCSIIRMTGRTFLRRFLLSEASFPSGGVFRLVAPHISSIVPFGAGKELLKNPSLLRPPMLVARCPFLPLLLPSAVSL